MASPARVLLIGSEHAHLETRAAVLEHFWQIGMANGDAMQVLKEGADVVVVFETLPSEERQGWVDRVRLAAPQVLVVKINGYDSGPHAGADATVYEGHGPGALVSAIYELLTERGLGSRAWPIPGEIVTQRVGR